MSLRTYLRLLYGSKTAQTGSGWKIFGMACAGLLLGKWYGVFAAEEQYSDEFLVDYENEDQLDHIVEQTGKPMVVLYYIGSDSCLWSDRHMMLKYSHLCRDRASFCMVNIAQHLMYISSKSIMRFPDPDNIRLQIRRPKQHLQITNAKGEVMEIEASQIEKPFLAENNEGCWRIFLQSEGILPVEDPAKGLLRVSMAAVFP